MKTTKIESDGRDIHLDCPHCDMWEQLGIDDPRKRLSALPIIEWKENVKGENEKSIHKCTQCENSFETEWDYDNPMTNKI
jgi:uncharacterized C2H2 Zn-finger protein